MKTRDSWHKKARKTNDKLHWNAFRFFRQEVKREIRIAEKEYVRSELLKSNGNTNSIWKIINHCLPNREPPLTTVEDPVVQANRFNGFYISVGQTAAVKAQALCDQYGFTTESVEQAEPITEDLQNINKFEFHAVTEKDIEKIVKHIPSNKAPGHDRVSARVLKDSLLSLLGDDFNSAGSFLTTLFSDFTLRSQDNIAPFSHVLQTQLNSFF